MEEGEEYKEEARRRSPGLSADLDGRLLVNERMDEMSSRKKRSAMTTRRSEEKLVFRTERPQTRSTRLLHSMQASVRRRWRFSMPKLAVREDGLGTDVVCLNFTIGEILRWRCAALQRGIALG